MAKLEFEVGAEELDILKKTWQLAKKYFDEEFFEKTGWNQKDVFFSDVFCYGVRNMKDDPERFTKYISAQKHPLFRAGYDKKEMLEAFGKI